MSAIDMTAADTTANTKAQAQKSPFWQFSITFYAVPGVAPACIALQDLAGVDVNLLFFLLWNATFGRTLNEPEIKELDHMVGVWRNTAVIPLREIRRALKSPQPILAPDVVKGFRNCIKAAELEAERLQQEAMYALAQSGRFGKATLAPVAAARASIAAYQTILRPLPAEALEVVLAAFAQNAGNG
jgi:uncharacterized protein (TIGR02444 family)